MIKIENLTFGYRKKLLYDNLQLNLTSGKIYGLLGKNGEGKTTLLKLITGLIKPTEGEISVFRDNPFKRNVPLLQEIFFLPEEFDLPRISITTFARIYGCFYPNFSNELFTKILTEFQVNVNQNLHKMSLGQKKKAYIAFALACNTKLIIMDEPTNGLDIPSKSSFRRIISSLATDERTIIISTHQVRDLDQLIDNIIILDNKEILINASVTEITEKLSFVHLEQEDEAIYSEKTIHGRWGVIQNKDNKETTLDMELLFNAAILSKETIKKIMNHDK